jgi:hypothetical protein
MAFITNLKASAIPSHRRSSREADTGHADICATSSQTEKKHSADDLFTNDGLANFLNVSPRATEKWRLQGIGPPFIRIGKRRVAYKRSDIMAWLDANTFKSTSEEAARII